MVLILVLLETLMVALEPLDDQVLLVRLDPVGGSDPLLGVVANALVVLLPSRTLHNN